MALAPVPVGSGSRMLRLVRGSEYALPADDARRLIAHGIAVRAAEPKRCGYARALRWLSRSVA